MPSATGVESMSGRLTIKEENNYDKKTGSINDS